MIRPSSIAMGELVAVNGNVKPGQILSGLNEVSFGSFPYSLENFRGAIADTTAHNSHSEILEATSDRLAAIIRETMETISTYGVPLATAVTESTGLLYCADELQSLAGSGVTINFVNTDDPFFQSSLFPVAVNDKTLSYKAIDLGVRDTLVFDYASEEQVQTFVGSNHPDVRRVMENPEANSSEALELITSMGMLKEYFSNDGSLFDFHRVKYTNVALLLKAYMILTRMYGSQDPAPWLKSGSLANYRAYVNLLWNGFTTYLITLRGVVNAYRAQKFIVVQEKPVAQTGTHRALKNARLMQGTVRVFYTDDFMEKVIGADASIREVVLGYLWASMNKRPLAPVEVYNNPTAAMAEAKDYFKVLHDTLNAEGRELFVRGGLKGIGEFVAGNPQLKERVMKTLDGSRSFADWLRDTFWKPLNEAYSIISEMSVQDGPLEQNVAPEISDRTAALLSTQLIPTFLRSIGCGLAADLISDTFVMSGDDKVGDKRERLHVSIINLIVARALV